MLRFFLHRLLLIVPTFIGITLVAFLFIRLLPGDPVILMAGERGVSPERHAELMAQFGFDQPLWKQYVDYSAGLLQGNFGYSFSTKKPVLGEFMARFPATLELGFCAIVLATVLGIAQASSQRCDEAGWVDQLTMGTALVGYSMPIFWWALLLIILFSTKLGWTPVSGRISLTQFFPPVTGFMLVDSLLAGKPAAFWSAVHHLILPTIVLGDDPAGGGRAADSVGDARGAGRDLRDDGQVEGADAAPGGLAARAAQRADPGRHHDRPAGQRADGGRYPDRDDLLLAGHRQVDDQFISRRDYQVVQGGLC